jgi:hypothetical protein
MAWYQLILIQNFGLKLLLLMLETCIITTIQWTANRLINTLNHVLFQSLDSNLNLPLLLMKKFCTELITIKIQICSFTGKDTKMVMLKWKLKSWDTSIFQLDQLYLDRLGSLITFILLASNKADAIRLLLRNGDVVDQGIIRLWEFYIGKWMTFGRVLLGQVLSMVADGNHFIMS